ncbi:F-box only protein 22-like [Ornithodoros turicata]|uniref:F-box only protein 22-like n=1 Tax=Ornithodoros turicata TaxID=34597 RepID=UPI003139EEB3
MACSSVSSFAQVHNKTDCYTPDAFGHLLSTSADVVERILKCLNYTELNKCAKVCALWHSTANRLKSKRCGFAHCFKVVERMKQVRVWRHFSDDSCFLTISEDVQAFLKDLKCTWCEPAFGIFFATRHISEYPGLYFPEPESFKKRKSAKATTAKSGYGDLCTRCVVDVLPKSCIILHANVEGIVGTPLTPQGWAVPQEQEKKQGLSGIFFPSEMPGVSFHPFYMPDDDTLLWPPFDTQCSSGCDPHPDNTEKIKNVEDIEDLKCVLVFTGCEAQQLDFEARALNVALEKYNGQFALGGAIVGDVDAPVLYSSGEAFCVGLCVAGKSVRAASIVLSESVRGPEAVEAELKRLKDGSGCATWGGKMVGFMFACVGRGVSFHRKRNLEAKTFAKVFPNVPLMGLFGNGELGMDYLPAVISKGETKQVSPPTTNSCMYGYTTVIVLLSFGVK